MAPIAFGGIVETQPAAFARSAMPAALVVSAAAHILAFLLLLPVPTEGVGGAEQLETISVDIVVVASPAASASLASEASAASAGAMGGEPPRAPVTEDDTPEKTKPAQPIETVKPSPDHQQEAVSEPLPVTAAPDAEPHEPQLESRDATSAPKAEPTKPELRETVVAAEPPPIEPRPQQPAQATPAPAAAAAASTGSSARHASIAATASPGAVAAFARRVAQALAKTPPRRLPGTGTVQVEFTVGNSGGLERVSVKSSSGNARLDSEAVAAVNRALLPAPPAGASARQRSFVIPYHFRRR